MSEDSEISLKDHIAIEAMKLLLSNEGIVMHFAITVYKAKYYKEEEYVDANAKALAEACYRIAREMRKARLEAFE